MFTKAKYAEYQITPNLMHAYTMHLQQLRYETAHYDSVTLGELHNRARALSLQILRDCVMRERLHTERDGKALDKLGTRCVPAEELLGSLRQLSEEYEAEYQRLDVPHAPFTPVGIINPPTNNPDNEATKGAMEKLALQSVNLHWQAVRTAQIVDNLESASWLRDFIRIRFDEQSATNQRAVKSMYETFYHRAMNEAKQAGWLAIQQTHRLNGTEHAPTQDADQSNESCQQEADLITVVCAWSPPNGLVLLNKTGSRHTTQDAQQASELYDREITFLDSMHAWYHADSTHTWLNPDGWIPFTKMDNQPQTLRARTKNLLHKILGTPPRPPRLPKDPHTPTGYWETRLNLVTDGKKPKDTPNTDCTPES